MKVKVGGPPKYLDVPERKWMDQLLGSSGYNLTYFYLGYIGVKSPTDPMTFDPSTSVPGHPSIVQLVTLRKFLGLKIAPQFRDYKYMITPLSSVFLGSHFKNEAPINPTP